MSRRLDLGLLALLPPFVAYLAFGAFRVDAPVGLIGLVFDRPAQFALVATAVTLGGAVLLFIRPIERRVAPVFAPSRAPTSVEVARLAPLLSRLGERARIDTDRLIVRVQESSELNAAAGAAHLLFITEAALRRSEPVLEALLAHELGHHRGMHPVATAVIWWLSLPGEALAWVFRRLRNVAGAVSRRFLPLGLVLHAVVLVWQIAVMWLYYAGMLLALWAARVSEYVADRAAADWGYRAQLTTLFASMDEPAPSGRLARLLATHPPTERRIARLAGGDGTP